MNRIHKIPSVIGAILVAVIVFNFVYTIWQHQSVYFSHNYWQQFPTLKQTFLDSQYVNKHPKAWIPDEVAAAYAGGELIRGTNPVLITPDSPPLVKYLAGVSVVLFDNPNIFTPIAYFLSLIMLYLIGLTIYKSKLWALVPVLFVSYEPLIFNQLVYTPLFDIYQLAFLLMSLYFFNKGAIEKKKMFLFFFLANCALGLFIAIKFFITGLTIAAAWYGYLLIHREKKSTLLLTVALPISVLILFLTYIRVFWFGYDLHGFLGIQKWIFLYHKSQLILPFSIWPLILFNQWYVWWGNKPILSDSQWLITWPIITVGSLLTTFLYLVKKLSRNKYIEVYMLWVIAYFLFFSFGQIASRYFVILLPILYLVAIYGLQNFISSKYFKREVKNKLRFNYKLS